MRSTVRTISCVVAALVVGTAAAAQDRTDFSGVWKPVVPARILSMAVTQSAAELTIVRRIESGGRETVDTFTYKFDGSETDNRMGRSEYKSKARWDGAALVLSSEVSLDGQSLGRETDVYRIEKGELVVESSLTNARGTFSTKRVYRKE